MALRGAGAEARLWTATFGFFVAFYALFVPLAGRLQALGIGGRQASLVLGSFAAAALVGRPLAAALVDRGGARRGCVVGALLLAASALGFAAGTTAPALLAARATQGLAYALFTTAA